MLLGDLVKGKETSAEPVSTRHASGSGQAEITLLLLVISAMCELYQSGTIVISPRLACTSPRYSSICRAVVTPGGGREHGRQKFMRREDLISFRTVVDHQLPAGQPFFDLGVAIDQCRPA